MPVRTRNQIIHGACRCPYQFQNVYARSDKFDLETTGLNNANPVVKDFLVLARVEFFIHQAGGNTIAQECRKCLLPSAKLNDFLRFQKTVQGLGFRVGL